MEINIAERNDLRAKLELGRFRKIKAKMLVEALIGGCSVKGNHKVIYGFGSGIHAFSFYYRGTRIVDVYIKKNGVMIITDIDAGEFDNTPATIRQRQDIRTAMAEVEDSLQVMQSVV